MEYDGHDIESIVAHVVRHRGINLKEGRGNMNASEIRALRKTVKPLVQRMYADILSLGIEFDEIVSIPRGGDRYADALCDLHRNAGQSVRRLNVAKSSWKALNPTSRGRLLVIDDLLASGGIASGVFQALRSQGYSIAGLGVAVDLQQAGETFRSSVPIARGLTYAEASITYHAMPARPGLFERIGHALR